MPRGEETGAPDWAPFPVQDWESYRRTPSWQAYASREHTRVEPGEPASKPAFREHTPVEPGEPLGEPVSKPASPSPDGVDRRAATLRAGLVLALVCLLAAATYLVADRRPAPATPVWVPADGLAATVRLQTGSGTAIGTRENAVLRWPQALAAGREALTTQMLRLDHPHGALLWRQTVRSADLSRAGGVLLLGIDGERVVLLGEDDALIGAARVFDPGLPLIVPGARGGGGWTSTGQVARAGDEVTTGSYRARLSATPSGDCVVVRAHLTVRTGSGNDGRATRETGRWRLCPGAGIVAAQRTRGSATAGFAPTTDPVPDPAARPSTTTRLMAPRGAPRAVSVVTAAAGDPGNPLGAPLSLPPLAVGPDLVARASSGQDVLLFRPGITGLLAVRGLHPGGKILGTAVVGTTVLADTTDRRLVAWTTAGLRRWQVRLPETLAFAPVPLDAGSAVTVTVSGRVSVRDAATGSRRWTARLPGAPIAAPTVGGGMVVLADRTGTLTALDAATGQVRWQHEAEGVALLAVHDGQVAAASVGFVTGYDLHSGQRQWQLKTVGSLRSLVPVASGWVAVGAHVLQGVDERGQQQWRRSGCAAAAVTDAWTVCWHSAVGSVVATGSGRTLSTLTGPETRTPPQLLVLGDRLWLFDRTTFATWCWQGQR